MPSHWSDLPEIPRLESERLILRGLAPNDAEAIFRYASDPEVTHHVLWNTHQGIDDSRTFLEFVFETYRNGEPASWGIVLKETNELVGTIGFVNRNRLHNRAEVGYVLARSHWNHGLATEALRRVILFGFDVMNLHRIEARCDAANPASARVMEKAGMTYEGTIRGEIFLKGAYRDMIHYGGIRD